MPMKFQLLHRVVKRTPVVSLNTVTHAVHIRLLARQIHNARILLTAAATLPAHLRRSLLAAARSSPAPPLPT
jgi:dTDP-4-amino-4,6-dideoxygalactose transaminase